MHQTRQVLVGRRAAFTMLVGAWVCGGAFSVCLAQNNAPRLEVTTSPTVLREQLKAAAAQKDAAAQVEICRRLLTATPADAALLGQLVRAQIEAADFSQAHATLELLARASGSNVAVGELRGDLAAAEEHPDEALRAWGEALRAANASPVERAGLLEKVAALQEMENHWEAAANAWRDLVALGENAGRRARLAVCLANVGKCADAAREMKAANALDATNATVKSELPRFEWLADQLPYWRTLETPQAQKNPATLFARARFLASARAYPAALAEAGRALEAAPPSCAARLLKGFLLYKLEKPDEAAALSVAGIKEALWLEDRSLLDHLRAADDAIAADPGKAANFSRRAAQLLACDQPALALPDAEQAVKLAPSNADAAVLLAAAFLRLDRMAQARAEAERAAALDLRSADAWAMLGRLEQERANFPAAIDALSRALTLQEQARWLQRREACLRAVGRNAEADRDRQRLGKLQPPSAPPAEADDA